MTNPGSGTETIEGFGGINPGGSIGTIGDGGTVIITKGDDIGGCTGDEVGI